MDNLCSIDKVSILHVESLLHFDSSKRCTWNRGIEGVTWKQVSEHDWLCEDNLQITMKGGQVLSIRGMSSVCHGVKLNENDVYYVTSRLCSNRSATSDKMIIDNIIRHHTGEVILHRMRHGDVSGRCAKVVNMGELGLMERVLLNSIGEVPSSNNNKGELKLHNHARALTQLGDAWIRNYVSEQLFVIDLLERTNKGSSYIAKSKDYQAFPREVYKIVTRSTL